MTLSNFLTDGNFHGASGNRLIGNIRFGSHAGFHRAYLLTFAHHVISFCYLTLDLVSFDRFLNAHGPVCLIDRIIARLTNRIDVH